MKDQYTCLPSSEPCSGGFSPLSPEGMVLDLKVTGLGSCWYLKGRKCREKEKLVKGSKQPRSPSPLTMDPFVFLCLVMDIPELPQMLSPLLPCRALLFASQWIYLPPYLILIKLPFSPPPLKPNRLKKNELVSHCFYHFGSKRMLCLACSAPSQKMNQQLLWQKLFPEWGNRDKKKTGQGEVSAVGTASPQPPWRTSLPFTGEGNSAAGEDNPHPPVWRHGQEVSFCDGVGQGLLPMAVPRRGAVGRGAPVPWPGAGGLGIARVTQIPAGPWKPRLGQAGGGVFTQAHRSRNTYLSWDCTMVWFALCPSMGKEWIISLCLDGLGPVFSCFKW